MRSIQYKMTLLPVSFLLVTSVALGPSCAAPRTFTDEVRSRATFEIDCPIQRVEVTEIGESAYGARGCGRRASYQCDWEEHSGDIHCALQALDGQASTVPASD